jgi:Zn-dependent peptidase ImmA (M78 family)
MEILKLQPEVLQWVRERGGLDLSALAGRMKINESDIVKWEETGEISLSRAKKLASYCRTQLGYLFLAEPLSDSLPVPDFRTVNDEPVRRPSPDLLETIHAMQRRQSWMRDFLLEEGVSEIPFIGSATKNDDPSRIALAIKQVLGLRDDWAREIPSWTDALRFLREKVETAGILIFINGIVGNNTHRKLDPKEFRGFILCDRIAPLIFINGADSRSAQMFTLAHELAHLWIGQDAVFNFDNIISSSDKTEKFCNEIAAEFLIPGDQIVKYWSAAKDAAEPYHFLARIFKVSPVVAARRCLDTHLITRDSFFSFYDEYIAAEKSFTKKKSGGDFWKTQNVRLGYRFGAAVIIAAKEGRLLFNDAYRLTDLKGKTFEKFADSIGIPLK